MLEQPITDQVLRAARKAAERQPSDPFVYDRFICHAKLGILDGPMLEKEQKGD